LGILRRIQGEKMKFDFGEVLGRMWKIGWNHKVLWLWQMLPALFSILILPFSFLGNPMLIRLLPEPWNQFANETWITVVFAAIFFVLLILVMFAGVIAQLATTYGALKVEKGAEKISFRELFSESLPFFWRVLGLYFIFGGSWTLLILAFMAVNILGSVVTMGLASICFMPFFFLMFPIALVGYSVMELAQAAIIADNLGTMDAISHGWRLFRANWLGVVLLMVVLYFALSMLSSVFIFPMMLPMMLLPMGMDSQGSFNNFMPVFLIIFFPLIFVFMISIQGILMAFFQSAWAVAYMRLSNNANTPIVLEASPQTAGL
jgi:hypothetical protein